MFVRSIFFSLVLSLTSVALAAPEVTLETLAGEYNITRQWEEGAYVSVAMVGADGSVSLERNTPMGSMMCESTSDATIEDLMFAVALSCSDADGNGFDVNYQVDFNGVMDLDDFTTRVYTSAEDKWIEVRFQRN